MLEVAGGQVAGPRVDVRAAGWPVQGTLTFRLDQIDRLLGVNVPNQEVERILKALGFGMARHTDGVFELTSYEVSVPGWRYHDVKREADVVEEVARHYGYDRIPSVLPPVVEKPRQAPVVTLEARARAVASGLGLSEVMTKSLTTPEAEKLANLLGTGHVQLANPLKEMSVLRTSLLPSLLEVLRYNRYQGQSRLGIFEIGKTYRAALPGETTVEANAPFVETLWLAGVVMTSVWEGMWLAEQTPAPLAADFFYAKGVVESILGRLQLDGELTFRQSGSGGPETQIGTLHPGRTAELLWDGKPIGFVGELHPQVAKDYDLPPGQKACAWVLDLTALALAPPEANRFKPFSRQPAALRDLAVVVPDSLSAADALAAIREVGGDLLEKVTLFDRFSGGNLPAGHVSFGFNLVYRAPDRTLSAADVEPTQQQIMTALKDRFGAVLRG